MSAAKNIGIGKTIGIIISAILFLVCAFIDVWYVYVVLYGEVKQVVNTYEVGLQTLADGSDTKYFIEIEYYSNENKNGLECFEIKFNYLLDENKNEFYSQGLQYVANSIDDNINLELVNTSIESKHHWSALGNYYDRNLFYSYEPGEISSLYNYASGNDYETTYISTNPIGDNSYFRIQLDQDLYLMKFKSSYKDAREPEVYSQVLDKDANYYSPAIYCWHKDSDYLLYDYTYFSQLLYNAMGTLKNGMESAVLFEFGNIFDYYAYDENLGTYDNQPIEDTTKVRTEMSSYYSIYVKKHADGIQKASQSMFNCIHGNNAFNITNDYAEDDYFIGRTIVDCNIYDFDYINIENGYCLLSLKDSFVNYYKQYSDSITLSICIDLDKLNSLNIKFYGFDENSKLNNFMIFDCYTIETINGEVVRTEVQYV